MKLKNGKGKIDMDLVLKEQYETNIYNYGSCFT